MYLDYLASWGPLILGHAHPGVVAAIQEAAALGISFGAPTPGEIELAQILFGAVPSLEMVRLVSSGTEACMSALRLARGVTGRARVIKFDGCYHGHADSFLVAAGSGVLTHAIPGSPGVPQQIAELTISLPYNDLDAVGWAVKEYPGEIAALIVEPVAGNMGVVPPKPGFLEGLRRICTQEDIILIFDEVITGFRLVWGGAQALYGVKPDLTCLGKIIGGGLPVGAYGGRRDLMEHMAPGGPVYQAGTLSGNPVAVAAGRATLTALALREWGEVFAKLPRLDAVFVPGGDLGHTQPKHLMALLEGQTVNLHRHHPKAQMWVSPQGFTQPWLDEFLEILQRNQPAWLTGIVHGPQVRVSPKKLREVVPAKYPIRLYPDITHSRQCQYPVPQWDVAFSVTAGREGINPRPMDHAIIARQTLPDSIGFITYSEGCNDDVNKIIWSSLGWNPEAGGPATPS